MRFPGFGAASTTPFVAALLFLHARPTRLHAQHVLAPSTTRWIGMSRCVSAQHPCADEHVIYKLRPANRDSSTWLIDASRIVDGDTTPMGRMGLTRDGRTGALLGQAKGGTWSFRVAGDSMVGTLTMSDGVVMRRAVARRP